MCHHYSLHVWHVAVTQRPVGDLVKCYLGFGSRVSLKCGPLRSQVWHKLSNSWLVSSDKYFFQSPTTPETSMAFFFCSKLTSTPEHEQIDETKKKCFTHHCIASITPILSASFTFHPPSLPPQKKFLIFQTLKNYVVMHHLFEKHLVEKCIHIKLKITKRHF